MVSGSLLRSPSRPTWDRSILLPSPTTPSARFAQDTTAGLKARAWVEEVIKQRLPEGDFAAAFKDGQGLCRLINTFQPGTIGKVETSASPFKQMANISAFIHACRTLGVREQVLFETLDLFNEKRLPQVVRCLYSLSEVMRGRGFQGPYLSTPDKPEIDPAVKAVVDISRGNAPAPGWGPATPTSGGAPNSANANCGGGDSGGGRGGGGDLIPQSLHLSLPNHLMESGGRCLSPGAHAAGRLTYGVYEGGGVSTPPPKRSDKTYSNSKVRGVEFGAKPEVLKVAAARGNVEPGTVEALAAQRQVDDGCGSGGGAEGGDRAVEYAGSALPVLNTPRELPSSRELRELASKESRTPSCTSTPRGESGGAKALSREEDSKRRREATARMDEEMEVALWIEGVTGITFPGKFWSSLKDGVLLCELVNAVQPGLVPRINAARAPFPEMENISAFLSACRTLGVAEHSLFDTKDLHEKRDLTAVVRCLNVLGATLQSTVPDFKGPFLGKKSEACATVNARGLRKQLGKGPGARGGIHALTGLNGAYEGACPADVPAEHADPTATITPADSPSGKRVVCRRETSDSAAGSGGVIAPVSPRPAMAGLGDTNSPGRGVTGATHGVVPPAILEEEAVETAVPSEQEEAGGGEKALKATTGGRNLEELFGGEAAAAAREEARRKRGTSGVGQRQRVPREVGGEAVVLQIQKFIELNTRMPWRVSGNMYESLRDGWQLALLANALRPGAVRRVHNSIQPARHVQNIASFLIACRRMGVARVLLFDIDDLYANRNQVKVARTLLALRALAADPDFTRARPSSLMGTSLLVSAAAAAAVATVGPKTETSSSAGGGAATTAPGVWK